MPAPRSVIAVVASVFTAALLAAACTERNPAYCNLPDVPCPLATQMCKMEIHTCVAKAGTGGAIAGTGGHDATDGGGDAPADALSDGSTDGDAAEVRTGCRNSNDCSADAGAPVCEVDAGRCVGCLSTSDCKTAAMPVCDPAASACVACLVSSDCAAASKTTPICDAKTCRACKADSECAGIGPGVCMSHEDGRCATDDETIYVENNPAICSDSTGGSSAMPYCSSQIGVNAVTPTKRLVVLRGPAPSTEWAFAQSAARITVVGKSNAVVSPGARIGIRVSAGTVTVRDLHVAGATATPGVVVDSSAGSAELHMDRCLIDTSKGGIQITGNSGYEIINTVVANNRSASTMNTGCGAWGGMCISTSGTPTVARLLNDTIVKNETTGIACADSSTVISRSIVVAPSPSPATLLCTLNPCCAGDTSPTFDPMLTSDYHLNAQSACIDRLAPSPLVPDDFDNKPRTDAESDCGADEYGN